VRWMVVGKKGAGTMRFRRLDIDKAWSGFTDRPAYEDAAAIAHHLVELYTNREVDRVVMIYNAFRSALSQQVEAQDILPVPIGDIAQRSPREIALEGTLLFEPDAAELLGSLLPSAVETSIYRALLESTASEHGARMAAMRNASDNAGDLIDGLTLAMNRARQAEITQEILEVVAGADALL
jgi:F-type H+-transporting ATPase subunit gamma